MDVFEQMLLAIGHELYGYALSTAEMDQAIAAAAEGREPAAAGPARRGDAMTR